MKSIRSLPIRQKVSVVIMLTTACALVLACGAFILYDYVTLRQATAHDIHILSGVVASRSAAALMFNDGEAANEILASVRTDPSIIAGAIYKMDGTRFVTYGPLQDSPERHNSGMYSHHALIESFEPIRYRHEVVGTLYLAGDFREVQCVGRRREPLGRRRQVAVVALRAVGPEQEASPCQNGDPEQDPDAAEDYEDDATRAHWNRRASAGRPSAALDAATDVAATG